jgi:hypothetical protein
MFKALLNIKTEYDRVYNKQYSNLRSHGQVLEHLQCTVAMVQMWSFGEPDMTIY